MSLADILAGNIIFADDVLRLAPKKARSTGATTFTSNTTYANITGLAIAVDANTVYKLKGRLKVSGSNTTHDMKIQFTLPSLATIDYSCYAGAASMTANPMTIDMGMAASHIRGTYSGTLAYILDGWLFTGANAGTVQLQGAQNVSDAGALSFDAHCEISLEEWV